MFLPSRDLPSDALGGAEVEEPGEKRWGEQAELANFPAEQAVFANFPAVVVVVVVVDFVVPYAGGYGFYA